jgi:tyrosine phenol-lyase
MSVTENGAPLPEPFKIKVVERIAATTREEREAIMKEAGYNLFGVPAEKVFIDLLTDSGTSAMSDRQWAGIMVGDEAYACCRNFYHLTETVQRIFGFKHVLPTHQGRAAEHILFATIATPESQIPSNTHFDTTRANIEHTGAKAVDFLIPEGMDPEAIHPFKGNIDIDRVETFIEEVGRDRVPIGMLTVTNNAGGGQPVSMENIRSFKALLARYDIPLFIDACRYAENAYFIKEREPQYRDHSIPEIVREMFSHADGCTVSAKKDGLVNIGGFIGTNIDELAESMRNLLILYEGFPTYGGLSGRDLEAMAIGLEEALDERHLAYRIAQVKRFGERLAEIGVPVLKPIGGHAVYIDVKRFLPHIPQSEFPGQALTVALYVEGGIRAVELGTVAFAARDPETGEMIYPQLELVRLAIPRRVYTQAQLDYVIDVFAGIVARKEEIKGLRMTYEAPWLRHFTAQFEPL